MKTAIGSTPVVLDLAPPEDVGSRHGGALKSRVLFDFARAWNEDHKHDPPFRLSVVDGFVLTGDRMETTSDGAHWVNEEEGREDDKTWSQWKAWLETGKPSHRKGVGEADGTGAFFRDS